MRLLDALEESIVIRVLVGVKAQDSGRRFGSSSRSLLVRVMFKDFLTVYEKEKIGVKIKIYNRLNARAILI